MKKPIVLAGIAVVAVIIIVVAAKPSSAPKTAPQTNQPTGASQSAPATRSASSGQASPQTPSQARINADGSINLGVNKYYQVKSTDPAGDTGNKVCAKVGKKCAGYTDFTLSSCLAFHPDAASVSDWDGARAGFYCNGLPQTEVCSRELNTCHICPQCGTNMDCDTVIGLHYRETFVECK